MARPQSRRSERTPCSPRSPGGWSANGSDFGGTRQITEHTAGIEPLMLRAAAYRGGRALDRTGSVVALEPEADWTVYGFTGLVEDLDATWRAFVDRLVL